MSGEALPLEPGDLVYRETLASAQLPTVPEVDLIGAGGLVGGGDQLPTYACTFGVCDLELDVSLASPGVASSHVEMAPGSTGTSSLALRADVLQAFLSNSGGDSAGVLRLVAELGGDSARLSVVRDRLGGADEWRLELTTFGGAVYSTVLEGDRRAALDSADRFDLDLYVDRAGHWAIGSLAIEGLPVLTTEAVHFNGGGGPLLAARLETVLINGSATPDMIVTVETFEAWLPAAPPKPAGLQVTGFGEINNDEGYLVDPGSPGTNSGTNVLGSDERFGSGFADPGDLDGDGTPDLVVGSPGRSSDTGAILTLFLNPDGTVKARQRVGAFEGGLGGAGLSSGDRFAEALHWLGPLSGGGAPFLAAGAPGKAESGASGSVFMLQMATDGTVSAHHRIADGLGGLPASSLGGLDEFGSGVASPGDLDGDGIPELAVGAPLDDHGGASSDDLGAVWILFLDSSGNVKGAPAPVRIAATTAGLGAGDRFGFSVVGLGDLDGAGPAVGAIAVGSPGAGASGEGAVTVLLLDAAGQVLSDSTIDAASGDLPAGAPAAGAAFGTRLAPGPDLDGDGRRELAVGAPYATPPPLSGATQGELWLLFLDAAGAVTRSEQLPEPGSALDDDVVTYEGFGLPGSLGDLDGNGVRELAVGGPWWTPLPVFSDRTGTTHVLFLDDATCGDGRAATGLGEQCDDGNLTAGDGCSDVCISEFCGDGILQPGIGEVCDDGNSSPNDGCSDTCAIESCGDGIQQSSEECDDGNTSPGDGCSDVCVAEFCGDGIVQAGIGETCDDGNTSPEDGCSDLCVAESCGDGVTQAGLGEECDDGNTSSEDGCSEQCVSESCGDGIVQAGLGEACDAGEGNGIYACSAGCTPDFPFEVTGTALGGQLTLRFSGVLIQVNTSAGQSASDVAAALVVAINGNATLAGLGITATASGAMLRTTAAPTRFETDDDGLALSNVEPASLSPLSGVWRVLDFDDLGEGTPIPSGSPIETIELGYSLEGETLEATAAFDPVSETNTAGLTGADQALLEGDAITIDFARPVLGVGVYLVTSDRAEAGEIRLTTARGTVTNPGPPLQVLPDGGHVYFLQQLAGSPVAQATLDFASDGEVHFLYSLDDVVTMALTNDTESYSGTATGGFSVSLELDGVTVQTTTIAGQSAAEVAEALAAEIRANATLVAAGTGAGTDGDVLLTNGLFANATTDDPGLNGTPVLPVPALPPLGLAVLALALALIPVLQRRRSRT